MEGGGGPYFRTGAQEGRGRILLYLSSSKTGRVFEFAFSCSLVIKCAVHFNAASQAPMKIPFHQPWDLCKNGKLRNAKGNRVSWSWNEKLRSDVFVCSISVCTCLSLFLCVHVWCRATGMERKETSRYNLGQDMSASVLYGSPLRVCQRSRAC